MIGRSVHLRILARKLEGEIRGSFCTQERHVRSSGKGIANEEILASSRMVFSRAGCILRDTELKLAKMDAIANAECVSLHILASSYESLRIASLLLFLHP